MLAYLFCTVLKSEADIFFYEKHSNMYIIVQNMKPYRRYEIFFKWHFSTDI